MIEPKPGEVYKHFKGQLYIVLVCSTHTETDERLVTYHSTADPEGVWTRPLEHWNSRPDCRPNELRFAREII